MFTTEITVHGLLTRVGAKALNAQIRAYDRSNGTVDPEFVGFSGRTPVADVQAQIQAWYGKGATLTTVVYGESDEAVKAHRAVVRKSRRAQARRQARKAA